jgi:hypothetical protein
MRYWAVCSSMEGCMVALDTTRRKARGRARDVGCARLDMVAVGPTELARRDHACGARIRPPRGVMDVEAGIPLEGVAIL